MKPFLKWAGGKRRVVPYLEPHLCGRPPKRLVEPFMGSAAVCLALHEEMKGFVLNDANADLVNVFEHLRDEPETFIEATEACFTPDTNTEDRFYALRDRFNAAKPGSVDRAALFIYLNRHGYNGLCRYNASGGFNVPFGRYVRPKCPSEAMRAAAPVLSRSTLTQGDFEPVLDACGAGDAVYCDPPYVPLSRTANFAAYATGGFDADDQTRLVAAAKRAAQRGAVVVISNHDTPESRELYEGARLEYIDVQRNISRDGATRDTAREVIAVFEPPVRRRVGG